MTEQYKNVIEQVNKAIAIVIPKEIYTSTCPFHRKEDEEISVEVHIFGDCEGKIVIGGKKNLFQELSKTIYGMELESDMLDSFALELLNIIIGNAATILQENELKIDITTPQFEIEVTTKGDTYHFINLIQDIGELKMTGIFL